MVKSIEFEQEMNSKIVQWKHSNKCDKAFIYIIAKAVSVSKY